MSYFSNVPLFILKRGTVFVMTTQHSKTDVILIGGGIMSATLGTLLKELSPEKNIKVFKN
ncbi:malate:quinone oxidoreductase [Staphylococcus aureus]